MRFKLDVAHFFPNDQYLEAGTIVGDGTPYPLPDDWEPSQHVTALDQEAEEMLAARAVRPDPLSEAALPNKIRPEDAMIQAPKEQPNQSQSPSDDGSRPNLSFPKTGDNISGSKPKK